MGIPDHINPGDDLNYLNFHLLEGYIYYEDYVAYLDRRGIVVKPRNEIVKGDGDIAIAKTNNNTIKEVDRPKAEGDVVSGAGSSENLHGSAEGGTGTSQQAIAPTKYVEQQRPQHQHHHPHPHDQNQLPQLDASPSRGNTEENKEMLKLDMLAVDTAAVTNSQLAQCPAAVGVANHRDQPCANTEAQALGGSGTSLPEPLNGGSIFDDCCQKEGVASQGTPTYQKGPHDEDSPRHPPTALTSWFTPASRGMWSEVTETEDAKYKDNIISNSFASANTSPSSSTLRSSLFSSSTSSKVQARTEVRSDERVGSTFASEAEPDEDIIVEK